MNNTDPFSEKIEKAEKVVPPQDRPASPPSERFEPTIQPMVRMGNVFTSPRNRTVPLGGLSNQDPKFVVHENTSPALFENLDHQAHQEKVVSDLAKALGSSPEERVALQKKFNAALGVVPAPVAPPWQPAQEFSGRRQQSQVIPPHVEHRIGQLELERATLLRLADRIGEQILLMNREPGF